MTVVDPLMTALLDAGATIGPFHGRQADLHYGDPAEEFDTLRSAAGIVLWEAARIEMTGGDRATLLHRLTTNAVTDLTPGAGVEAFLTDARGHTLGHILAFAAPESLVIHAPAGQSDTLRAHLGRYILREDVQLRDRSDEWFDLLLAGPGAAEVLARAGAAVPAAGPLTHVATELAGAPALVRRVEFTGPDGLLIGVDRAAALSAWRALREAGGRPCGQHAAAVARIAAGWPLFGIDITAENFPQEVGRDAQAISFNKGCYLGQETVARIDSRGHVNRQLVGLRFDAPQAVAAGLELAAADNKSVGRVTSAAWAAGQGVTLALGYVRREHRAPGTRLQSSAGPAVVVSLPMLS